MSLATAAINRTKFKKKYDDNTPVWIVNAQFLQISYVHAKITSLFQYTHYWWWLKIKRNELGNQLIKEDLLTNKIDVATWKG